MNIVVLKRIKYIVLLFLVILMTGCESKIEKCNKILLKYDESCEKGIVDRCEDLGLAYRDGYFFQCDVPIKQDSLKAKTFLKKACDGDRIESCHLYATLSMSDLNEKSLLKACKHNYAMSCGLLGVNYYIGSNLPKNDLKALKYLKKGCEYGDEMSCANLGVIYENGEIVQRNINKAINYYKKACDGGEKSSCGSLWALVNR